MVAAAGLEMMRAALVAMGRGHTPTQASAGPSNSAAVPPLPKNYTTVTQNETPRTIALHFSVDLDELMQLNTANGQSTHSRARLQS